MINLNIEKGSPNSVDIVIVGGGLAGIKAACESSKSGLKIALIVKEKLGSGASFYPMMESLGCQAPLDNEEDKAFFLEEIEHSSAGMNDTRLCRIYIESILERITELQEIGINVKKHDNKIACFAKRQRAIYSWGGWSTIRSNLNNIFRNLPNVTVLEDTAVIHIIKNGRSITGVVTTDKRNRLLFINCKSVILATGGLGNLYKHNLNTNDVSGDGHILAFNSGAKLINMEFIQFIPGFMKPQYKIIFREGSLNHCQRISNLQGENILERYFENNKEQVECLKKRATHGPFTSASVSKYFDIAMMNEIIKTGKEDGFILEYSKSLMDDKNDFVKMYVEWMTNEKNIDLINEDICIAPFYHASNGGIWIDEKCRTGVDGLFAAGESAGGIHGADRHGGNSTGSCFVFGYIAARSAVEYSNEKKIDVSTSTVKTSLNFVFNSGFDSILSPDDILIRIRDILWFDGNIIREEKRLLGAIKEIDGLKKQYNAISFFNLEDNIGKAVKAYNFLELAPLLLRIMNIRKESRGSHYRSDYPERNDEQYNKRIVAFRNDDNDIEIRQILKDYTSMSDIQ